MSQLDEVESADQRRQEHAALLEQRANDPEWQPLAEHIRKKLGEEFTLSYDELFFLVKGAYRTPRVVWPGEWPGNVARLLRTKGQTRVRVLPTHQVWSLWLFVGRGNKAGTVHLLSLHRLQ